MALGDPNLKPRKKGHKLTQAEWNAAVAQVSKNPSRVRGFVDKNTDSTRQFDRGPMVEFYTDYTLPAWSIFHAQYIGGRGDIASIYAGRKGWGIFTNGGVGIYAGSKGVAFPLNHYAPTLVRMTTDGDFRPQPMEICGVGDGFVGSTLGVGLLCLNYDPSGYFAWCVRHDQPIDVIARATAHVPKREKGNFECYDAYGGQAFPSPSLLYAINLHWAAIEAGAFVHIRATVEHGLTAKKWNGGMWIGTVNADIEGDQRGAVTVTATEEVINDVLAPPDGLAEDGNVNIIEYNLNDFYAYPLDCDAVLDGGGSGGGSNPPNI